MFQVNEDLSIYVTRGDVVYLKVSADNGGKPYTFEAGEVVRLKIYGKKNAENVVLQKDFPVVHTTQGVEIILTEADTKIGSVVNKPVDYWYEVELNPYDNPQTIIGYDEDGAKLFRLFPEGADVPEYEPPKPEDIPIVDEELDMTSPRPVQNQAIARVFARLEADVEDIREHATKTYKTVLDMVSDLELAENDRCITLGYYSINDGGAASYLIQKSNDAWAEQLSNGLYAYLVRDDFDTIDLRQHGCHCNGVDSDSKRLNEIVGIYKSANKRFVFDGTLVLDQPIRFDTSNIAFCGKGQYSSFVRLTTDSACLEFVTGGTLYNLTLSDMSIVGNGNNKVLRISGYHNISIKNVLFNNQCTDEHPIEILGSVIFVDSCTFDGGDVEMTFPTKRMILLNGAVISFLNCNIWNLKSLITAKKAFYVSVEQCWVENIERIVEYYNNSTATTYAHSTLSVMNSNVIKSGGEFYYLFSDTDYNNLTEQRLQLVGNRNYIANIDNPYLSRMVSSFVTIILTSTDGVGYDIVDAEHVPAANVIYTGFGHNGKNGSAFLKGDTLSVKKLCLSDTYSPIKNILYVAGNNLYFIDNDGKAHTVV